MADAKRWSVTYTKHVKQKRKVYQDGFLELHASTNKLFLYDDCEKLLECRILKRDEVVSCGETLTFNAFLVDVNNAEGHHDPPPFSPTSSSLGRSNRNGAEKSKSQKLNLSPSQQIIRDFKKREILKYEALQTKSPDATKFIATEWEVLYTTQIIQKAKKYHDGFIQLSVRGSIGGQVMLFDASRSSLSSRFIKKDEKIESGETIAFDGYLVEIGEPRGNQNSSGENNSSITREREMMQGHKNYAYRTSILQKKSKTEVQKNGASLSGQDATEIGAADWQVLYTTQLIQKSKKYHDGFLQLAICGSRGRQAMLYDANKTILHSGFLKKEEVIRTGLSLKFDAYLIDIGEPEGNNETDSTALGKNCNAVKDIEKVPMPQNSLTSNNYSLKGKTLPNAGPIKNAKLNFSISKQDIRESSVTDHTNKPLRDARQILSFLQKPKPKNTAAVGYTDNKTSPTKGPLDSNAAKLDFSEDDQLAKLSAQHDQMSKNAEVRKSTESADLDKPQDTKSSKVNSNCAAISSLNGSQLNKDIHNGNSNQKLCSVIEADNGCRDGANSSNMPSDTASQGQVYDVKKPSEAAKVMDEFPSFDLGF